jgi:putative acetyltransferase
MVIPSVLAVARLMTSSSLVETRSADQPAWNPSKSYPRKWVGRSPVMMRIIQGDLNDPRVVALLQIHLTSARAATAPGSAHALDISDLQSSDITFWTIWDDEMLLGMGALKRLSADHGEIKSMYIVQSMRRRGAGSAMLHHIIIAARANGMSRLSLETGSWDYFQPAHALYRSCGFVECPPFAEYVLDPNSLFMSLELRES